jgi:hypothetical protein
MSLIKKIDVEKHFAARRAMRRGGIRLPSLPGAAHINPAPAQKETPAFIEDYAVEHSLRSACVAPLPITSDVGRSRLLRAPGSRQR